MAFDIKTQDYSKSAEQGFTFNIILPDGTESDAKLTVIGDLSATVQNYAKRKYKEIKSQIEAAKRRGKEWEPTLDEAEDESVEGALVRLIGWEGFEEEGEEVKFSKEKAAEVLKQHSWLREQIYTEAKNTANFTPKA